MSVKKPKVLWRVDDKKQILWIERALQTATEEMNRDMDETSAALDAIAKKYYGNRFKRFFRRLYLKFFPRHMQGIIIENDAPFVWRVDKCSERRIRFAQRTEKFHHWKSDYLK